MESRVRQLARIKVAAVSTELAGACARMLQDHLARLRGTANHPNRVLHYDELLSALLLGFFDPTVRSLRTLDGRSVSGETITQSLDRLRLAKSTISDAMAQLSADALLPLMQELLKRARSSDVVILDTRPAREYEAGHIAGAISVPVADLRRRLKELPANKEYVAYCRGPYCVYADQAVKLLQARGRRARRLLEGFPEWRAAGLPVETGAPASR